ncbi:hypothetical protein BDZ89DRAFT_560723 [Hymenopellis radicata]|nr:hypothetical protein BDZ89DRAFT_560723 [Hymenopellis radicata]
MGVCAQQAKPALRLNDPRHPTTTLAAPDCATEHSVKGWRCRMKTRFLSYRMRMVNAQTDSKISVCVPILILFLFRLLFRRRRRSRNRRLSLPLPA